MKLDVNPTAEDFDELLAYLPVLYAHGFKAVNHWNGGTKTSDGTSLMPWPVYEGVVVSFFEVAAQKCWTDYEYTSKEAGTMLCEKQRVARATLEEIKTMLTWCVRGERFCAGHWDAIINDGRIRSLLLRLLDIKSQLAV